MHIPSSKILSLEDEISCLKSRNLRVEREKAWETSWQRRLSISVLTYLVMILMFFSLGNPTPWTSAIIPTLGYILSTLSLGLLKHWFMRGEK